MGLKGTDSSREATWGAGEMTFGVGGWSEMHSTSWGWRYGQQTGWLHGRVCRVVAVRHGQQKGGNLGMGRVLT